MCMLQLHIGKQKFFVTAPNLKYAGWNRMDFE